jgi:hypothetical protein
MGHVGIVRLYQRIVTHFAHPQLKQRIEYVKSCDACLRSKLPGMGYGQLVPPREAGLLPWNEVAVDFLIGPWTLNIQGARQEFCINGVLRGFFYLPQPRLVVLRTIQSMTVIPLLAVPVLVPYQVPTLRDQSRPASKKEVPGTSTVTGLVLLFTSGLVPLIGTLYRYVPGREICNLASYCVQVQSKA